MLFERLKPILPAAFVLSFAVNLVAQESAALNDQRIVDLVAMGVSQQEILRMVASAPKFDFDLRPISTEAMVKLGVSEEIIKAMAARESGHSFSTSVTLARRPGPAPGVTSERADPTGISTASFAAGTLEVGAYYQSDGEWVQMMPEMADWGRFKVDGLCRHHQR